MTVSIAAPPRLTATSLAGNFHGWRYPAALHSRDLRLDLLRGLCLLKMVFNHLPATALHPWQRWLGYVSAAEGFFFISGAVVGIVYGRKALTEGFAAIRRRLWTRAAQLYLANLSLVFLFLALEVSGLLEGGVFGHLWSGGRFHGFQLLAFNQPYFLHVLTRYVAFLLVTPIALRWLLAGRTRLLLAVSGALYLLGQALGPNPRIPFLEDGRYQAFPILIWQLVFFAGLACGFHRQRLARGWRRLEGRLLPAALLAGSLGFVLLKRAIQTGVLPVAPELVERWLGRTDLGPLRLINLALVFCALFWLTDRAWKPVVRLTGWILLPFGQASLYVFLVHILLVAAGSALLPHLPFALHQIPGGVLLFDLGLILVLWALTRRRVLFGFIPT